MVYHAKPQKDDNDENVSDDYTEYIKDETVVADFYLPYVCCDDYPMKCMDFVKIIFSPVPKWVCVNQLPIDFTVSPAGGVGSSEGFTPKKDGEYTFDPDTDTIEVKKTFTFTYTIGNCYDSFDITVFNPPDKIKVKKIREKRRAFNFEAEIDKKYDEFPVHWDMGDGTRILQESRMVEYEFESGKNHRIEATLVMGPCRIISDPFPIDVPGDNIFVVVWKGLKYLAQIIPNLLRKLAGKQREAEPIIRGKIIDD